MNALLPLRRRLTVAERLAHLGIAPKLQRRLRVVPSLPQERRALSATTKTKLLAVHMASAQPRSALK